jgi:hypothetical protein
MKRRIAMVVLLTALPLWLTAGCQPQNHRPDANAKLPPDAVGTWLAKDSRLRIVVSPDGTVSSAVIPLGEVELRPNQAAKVAMKDGSFSTYKAGDFAVDYSATTRELFVSLVVEEFHIKFMEARIDGNETHRFIGPVSEDGKSWTADWIHVFDYGPQFPQDPNEIGSQKVVFEKIAE